MEAFTVEWLVASALLVLIGAVVLLSFVVIEQGRTIKGLHRSLANVYRDNDTLTEAGWRSEVCGWMLEAATYYRDESEDESRPGGARLHSYVKAEAIMEMVKGVSKGRYKAAAEPASPG